MKKPIVTAPAMEAPAKTKLFFNASTNRGSSSSSR